jgi:peptidoglycan/xylan/chitin deacetylase (PgdA/CDA1 family)
MAIHETLLSLLGTVGDITPLIPYYHVISNDPLPHIRHLYPYKNERQFIADLETLGRRYPPVSLDDLMDFAKRGKTLKKGSFIVTFDDGYSQIHSVAAPILFKKGIPAIFFLTTDFVDNRALSHNNKASLIVDHLLYNGAHLPSSGDPNFGICSDSIEQTTRRILAMGFQEAPALDEMAASIGLDFNGFLSTRQPYLSSIQIRELIRQGFSIGAHSLNHPYFGNLPLQDQIAQTRASVEFIKDHFGPAYSVFAFPHDDRPVGRAFFNRIQDFVDLSFGTSGIMRDPIATNLQRVNFERTLRPAAEVLWRQLAKKIIYGRSERTRIKRDAP